MSDETDETAEANDLNEVSKADETTEMSETDRMNGEPSGSDSGIDADTVIATLKWGALLTLGVLAIVALAGLYTSLGSIIDVWVAHEYRPFARAGVNLAVLAAAVAGIVAMIRRT